MRDKLIVYFFMFTAYCLSWLPIRLIRICGTILGTVMYYLMISRRNIGITNLTLCFPNMTKKEKRNIIRQHFGYLMTASLEYGLVLYASREKVKKLVKFKNIEYLKKFYDKVPTIVVCPHFVGLEMSALRLGIDFGGFGMYSPQKNTFLTKKIKEARLRFIKELGGDLFLRSEGIRPIVRKLIQTKKSFYYLPDQDLGKEESLFLPFFAYPHCATITALPKLARLTKALVLSMMVKRTTNGYEIEFFEEWKDYPTGNLENDVIRMNQEIEKSVLKALPEYFWLHKKFKTHPTKERGEVYK